MRSAILGLAAAVCTYLVTKGVIAGEDSTALQGILAALLTLAAAVGIRGLRD